MSKDVAPVPTGKTVFENRYEVNLKKPLPEFSTAGGTAYVAVDSESPGKPYYALVQHRTVPIRARAYTILKKQNISNIVSPVARGLMNLSLGGSVEQRMVTIFTRPTGGVLMSPEGQVMEGLSPTRLRQTVVISVVKALATLHSHGVLHRNVMPTRMYFQSEDSDTVILGECISTPVGYNIPLACEPLELAFAEKAARGGGTTASDFFQFGVALASIYLGGPRWQGKERTAALIARVNQGSYWSLTGGRDIPGALGNLVRGLMADMLDERWEAEDVLDWFEGLAKPKRASLKAFSMNRPTNFKGVAYVDRRLLADAFNQDEKDAAVYLRKQDFGSWVQLAMRDEVLSERVESLLNVQPASNYGSMSSLEEARMVSRVCMFLDPSGPIRYKGLTLWLDGLPAFLADILAHDERDKLTLLVELMDMKHLKNLVDIAGTNNPSMGKRLVELREFIATLHDKQLGKGVERALYMLNPSLPCLSPRFSRLWISSVKQMMSALDRWAEEGGAKNILQDRHTAAFIATHGGNLDREFAKLSSVLTDPTRFAIASMEFLGMLQVSTGVGALVSLANRLVEGLAPAVKSLRNKKNREAVQTLLDKVKKGGDIAKLTSEVNLQKFQAQDTREFNAARTAVMRIDRERKRLSQKILPKDPIAMARGARGARTFALLCLVGTIVILVL